MSNINLKVDEYRLAEVNYSVVSIMGSRSHTFKISTPNPGQSSINQIFIPKISSINMRINSPYTATVRVTSNLNYFNHLYK